MIDHIEKLEISLKMKCIEVKNLNDMKSKYIKILHSNYKRFQM